MEKKGKRKDFPIEVQLEILLKCRRTCALCYYLEGELNWKPGQLAHIDRDPSNVSKENAAYLCMPHHDEYDSERSQTKKFLPAELKACQEQLYEVFKGNDWRSVGSRSVEHTSRHKHPGVSLQVYERRLPIYKATIEFLRDVLVNLKPDIPRIFRFARDTEEALFLFDDVIAKYLDELAGKASRLHSLELRRGAMASDDREIEGFQSLVKEEMVLYEWFTQQYDQARRLFVPFLRLST
jgi:hypothetical protein